MFRDLQIWLNHFEYHAEHPRCIPAGLSDALKPDERRLIARSIATFQLGEQSSGSALLRAAHRSGQAHEAGALSRIMEMLIREEQRHAALLRAFMEDHGVATRQTDWTDFAFCCLRRCGGFELRLHVLITAELIGNVYYRALEAATGCQRLKILCRTLVADELAHVGFESYLLLTLRARRPAVLRTVFRLLHRTFLTGAACVVWLTHRGVLRRAGYTNGSFLRVCAAQYSFYLDPPVTQRVPPPAYPGQDPPPFSRP